ncbi:DUF4097 family beta strand repeat-containing protein [Microlunatus parietis]|uniref:DUF4097 domain-containing protein n=1 Tax=Microlunatus parietis TaxID=682979 RepID=A0A7Y9LEC4_9ACTN|nr:DUF4097 family beta strand repeat-containing protein [Microlunatus parietis]NYE74792.1 hypothetical protein [Microlunatus parietis]
MSEMATTMITPTRRRMLIIVLPLLALSVVIAGLIISQDLLPGTRPYEFSTERAAVPTVTVDAGRTGVDLDLRAGPAGRIRVYGSGSYSGEVPEITVSDDGSRIDADCPSSSSYDCELELSVEVPEGTTVIATNRDGPIEAQGFNGSLRLSTRDGQIRITDAAGPIDAESDNGRILVEESSARSVSAKTRNSEITLELLRPDSVDASTTNGTIGIDLGPCQPYAVEADAGDEALIVVPTDPRAPRTVRARASNGSVFIECGG